MKITRRIEEIFAHAVALEQSGKLRSTVFCVKDKIYILNQDHTVLMRFSLRDVDKIQFDSPISFFANDYDSEKVEIENGKIQFIQSTPGWERIKSCKTPNISPEEVEQIFSSHKVKPKNTVALSAEILPLLDESLSHIEFSVQEGVFKIVQRNIYSGGIITITKKESGGLLDQTDSLEDFEPVGLRTNDFLALFTFTDCLNFHFLLEEGFIAVSNTKKTSPMQVLISKCKYDEMGTCHDEGKK